MLAYAGFSLIVAFVAAFVFHHPMAGVLFAIAWPIALILAVVAAPLMAVALFGTWLREKIA